MYDDIIGAEVSGPASEKRLSYVYERFHQFAIVTGVDEPAVKLTVNIFRKPKKELPSQLIGNDRSPR
jgi:hypothetical protein